MLKGNRRRCVHGKWGRGGGREGGREGEREGGRAGDLDGPVAGAGGKFLPVVIQLSVVDHVFVLRLHGHIPPGTGSNLSREGRASRRGRYLAILRLLNLRDRLRLITGLGGNLRG